MNLKKLYLLVVMLVAVFGFTFSAKAAGKDVTLSCSPTKISIVGGTSETSLCTVSIKSDTAVKTVAVTLDSSKYLEIGNIKANSLWTQSKSSTTAGEYAFNAASGSVPAGEYELFSFTIKLSASVKEIQDADYNCGSLCIKAASIDGTEKKYEESAGTGTCFAPLVEVEECEGDSCKANPETGAFTNYIVVGLAIAAALVAIIIARRKNKFFRV